jgi:hypothetical protein
VLLRRQICRKTWKDHGAGGKEAHRLGGHSPINFDRNFSASSPTGYWNNKRGANGTIAANAIMVSRRGPAVIHRISFTSLKALLRSASD